MSHNQEESRDSFAFVKSDAAYTFEALDEWNPMSQRSKSAWYWSLVFYSALLFSRDFAIEISKYNAQCLSSC